MIIKGGYLIIVSGPSGSGKSTITKSLLEQVKNLDFSISCTTRQKRTNELEGEDYKFVTKDIFHRMIQENQFLEYETVHNELYGTPINPIKESVEFGYSVLLDIDVKGASSIMNTNHFDCCSIFIKTPSIEILKKRLLARNDLSSDKIESRIEEAKNELKKSTYFNHLVINDSLDETISEVKRILAAL